MPQLEGPTTKSTQLCTGGFGEKKEKIKSLKKKKISEQKTTKYPEKPQVMMAFSHLNLCSLWGIFFSCLWNSVSKQLEL